MTHRTHIITCIFLLLITVGGYAQQTCYQIGINEGTVIYNEAQRLERNGRCVDAVPQYWEALRRFRLTRSCRDVPVNNELNTWEDRCIRGITACGGKIDESTFLIVSPGSLSFTGEGGNRSITVNANASWRVNRSPSWCTTQISGNRLTITSRENAETTDRSDRLVIVANTLTYEVTITQEGKTISVIPTFESIKISDVTFSSKYTDDAPQDYGDGLYNNMSFLLPRIVYNHLLMESKSIKLDYKILDPNGTLLPGTDNEYTYSEEITLQGNFQNDVLDVLEWGNVNGTMFDVTGKYTYEIWCDGTNMYTTFFEVLPKPVPPYESIKITNMRFRGGYDDNSIGNYDIAMYNNMTSLLSQITFDELTADNKTIIVDFNIFDAAGNLIYPTSDNKLYMDIATTGGIQQNRVLDISGFGKDNEKLFAEAGIYRFEASCKGIILFSTSFEVLRATPIRTARSTTVSGLKTNLGIKAGLNMATIVNNTNNISFTPEMKAAFHVGVFLNLNFGSREQLPGFFSFQPELLYARQGFAAKGEQINFDYITVPLMAKLYLYKGFNFELGPWFSYLLSVSPNNIKLNRNNIRLSDLKGGKDVGVAVGIGYDFDMGLVVGARYQHGLSDMADNLLWKNQVISISLGWKF